jgi:sugar O-acyltransferase (sialic acid O-acetyltransferase NeuD family)
VGRVVVVGASQHAKYTIDAMIRQGIDTIVGLVDDDPDGDRELVGYPILGRIDDLPELAESQHLDAAIVAIGDNWTRAQVAGRVAELCPSLTFATAIHPSAQIGARTMIGPGTVVMAGVVVNNDGVVGDHAFLATSSSLDHDSQLDAFASFSPNVATGGTVHIGAFSAIGIGASIVHGVTIGTHTVVGAGSTVLGDLPDHVVAFGTPARVVGRRAEGERYL